MVRPFPASGLRAVEGRAFVVHCPVAGFPTYPTSWKGIDFAALTFCMMFDRRPQTYFYLLYHFCSITNPNFGWLLPNPTRFSP